MPICLLDTDTLSELLKQQHPVVAQRAHVYLQQHQRFAFSLITCSEVVRGLQDKEAMRQLGQFETFCQHSLILNITQAILDRTAKLWAAAHRAGLPRNDADLIVAATALEHRRVLVTGSPAHFTWIPGLVVEDWRQPSSGAKGS